MKRLGGWIVAASLLGCTAEDVVLVTVQNGGGTAQGGAAQGGAAQGGAGQGGAAQGGTGQGGAGQGGTAQGGADLGGSAQGGDSLGGAAGTSQGGSEQGGTAGLSSGGSLQSGGSSSTCRSNADCDAGFCEKLNCADELGHCERRDVFCEGQKLAPVCGCDNVTYFNDCWRRQTGVPLKSATECKDQLAECDRSSDCQNGAMCARLFAFGDRCPPGRGLCWNAPDNCDSITDAPNFIECGPTPGRCVDMCTAIHLTGHPFTRAPVPCSQLQP